MDEKTYRQIPAWQEGMQLAVLVTRTSEKLNREEHGVLIEEMLRTVIRISAYVAEGWGRKDETSFVRLLNRAIGCVYRLSTVAELCEHMEFEGDWNRIIVAAEEVRKLIQAMIERMEA